GLGWRPALSAGILANLDAIDVIEVIAEDCFDAAPPVLDGLRALGRRRPLFVHGVGLGAASTIAVDDRRLDLLARTVDRLAPEAWSEHLAFVRAGGVEIGHLAAPPRTIETIEGLAANVERARKITGVAPALEN